MKLPNFTPLLYGSEYVSTTQKFLFLLLNLNTVLLDSTLSPTFAKLKVTKIDVVWNSANSLFKWRFGLVVIQKFATKAPWGNDFSLYIFNYVCLWVFFLASTSSGVVRQGNPRQSCLEELDAVFLFSWTRVPDANRYRNSGFLELNYGFQKLGFRIPQEKFSRFRITLHGVESHNSYCIVLISLFRTIWCSQTVPTFLTVNQPLNKDPNHKELVIVRLPCRPLPYSY